MDFLYTRENEYSAPGSFIFVFLYTREYEYSAPGSFMFVFLYTRENEYSAPGYHNLFSLVILTDPN
jgi:hypothetical protein